MSTQSRFLDIKHLRPTDRVRWHGGAALVTKVEPSTDGHHVRVTFDGKDRYEVFPPTATFTTCCLSVGESGELCERPHKHRGFHYDQDGHKWWNHEDPNGCELEAQRATA